MGTILAEASSTYLCSAVIRLRAFIKARPIALNGYAEGSYSQRFAICIPQDGCRRLRDPLAFIVHRLPSSTLMCLQNTRLAQNSNRNPNCNCRMGLPPVSLITPKVAEPSVVPGLP